MTCKDCLHYEVCGRCIPSDLDIDVFDFCRDGRTDEIHDIEERCNCFKDKSEWVHLPCKVGDTLYKMCPQGRAVKMGAMWDGKIVTPCKRCPWENCQCFDIGYQKDMENIIQPIKMKSIQFIFNIKPYIGKIWFMDKEEAEKALTERRK